MTKIKRAGTMKAAIALLYAALVLPFLHSSVQASYQGYLQMQYMILSGRHGFPTVFIPGLDRYLVINYLLLLFVPLLIILLAYQESPEEYGLGLGDKRASWRFFLGIFAPMFVVLAIAARFPSFQSYYPIYPGAQYHWRELLFWEIAYNGFYMFSWEFFFRGFLVSSLQRGLGTYWAIGIQAVAFGAMHYGKPTAEFWSSFLAGVALGIIAVRTRSFLATYGLHTACATSFDLLVLAWGHRLLG